jgi:hypothetical protein
MRLCVLYDTNLQPVTQFIIPAVKCQPDSDIDPLIAWRGGRAVAGMVAGQSMGLHLRHTNPFLVPLFLPAGSPLGAAPVVLQVP